MFAQGALMPIWHNGTRKILHISILQKEKATYFCLPLSPLIILMIGMF
jgi:hypothetical protein